MRLIRAARFAGAAALVAGIYSLLVLRPVYFQSFQTPHLQAAAEVITTGSGKWEGWLWLLTIFSWMILLAAMKHYYTPVHRISTSIQSGLTVISATLSDCRCTGRNEPPRAEGYPGRQWSCRDSTAAVGEFVDYIALTILAAGLLMGGGVTTWICFDYGHI